MKKFLSFMVFGLLAFTLSTNPGCKKDDDNSDNNTDTTTPPPTTVTDVDGNVYNIITIGSQTWMKENLKVTHYRNGDPVTYVQDMSTWANQGTSGMYCHYDFDANNLATYGRLYNHYAVTDTRGLAPSGWHIPSDAEWTVLTDYLGGESDAGGKMKETGTTHWSSPNTGADNSSGFTALPGGYIKDLGYFLGQNACAYFWSTTLHNVSGQPYFRSLFSDNAGVTRSTFDPRYGFSIRCIKD